MKQEKPGIRLYVALPLAAGAAIELSEKQSHYLANVMRVKAGDAIAVFNGQDGEWLATVETAGKKQVTLRAERQLRRQQPSPDLWLVFAPIKAKTERVVEKAVELGASKLIAVFSRYAVVTSVNLEKLSACAIEAAEQCRRMDVPAIETCRDVPTLLAGWSPSRLLLYGDESGGGEPLPNMLSTLPKGDCGLLIGPEGGFSAEEHRRLKSLPFVRPFTMGPRIMRADTAAVAALACIQSQLGDWNKTPQY